ncbi:MAG: hypothetical protein M3Q06_14795 [Bacteroidota bacterium]|nr:hypothetical protein [Bacteroidota bacterium]
MRKSNLIQKAVAWFLMVVFTISVMPEHLFHDALATHTDQPVCRDEDKSVPHIHNPTFHCSFDELVVSVPYIDVASQPVINQPVPVETVPASFHSSALSTTFRYTESRGPPLI